MIIAPYKRGLASTLMLKDALPPDQRVKVVRQDSELKRSTKKLFPILYWGGLRQDYRYTDALNTSLLAIAARMKWETYRLLDHHGVPQPLMWVEKEDAIAFRAEKPGAIILERHTLTGSNGEGIVVKRRGEALSDAQGYQHYIRKDREVRLVVVGNNVVRAYAKRKANEGEDYSGDAGLVRNSDNGWRFVVLAEDEYRDVLSSPCWQALVRSRLLRRSVLGIDMIRNKKTGEWLVLEVNSAPGLSPAAAAAIVDKVEELYG